jgi:hypothetical protein
MDVGCSGFYQMAKNRTGISQELLMKQGLVEVTEAQRKELAAAKEALIAGDEL